MSWTAKKWVRKHSPTKGRARAVLLELALCADDQGRGAYLSTAQIAENTTLSDSTVKRALRDLEAAQLIVRHKGCVDCVACASAPRRGAHVFDVVMPEAPEDVDPNQLNLLGGSVLTPGHDIDLGQDDPRSGVTVTPHKEVEEVSLSLDQVRSAERPEENCGAIDADELQPPASAREAREGARGPRKPVTYRGRRVATGVVDLAEQLLGAFNEGAGSSVGAWKNDGRPSQALKQIVGAVMERPDEPAEVWDRGVRSMLAEPPEWIEDKFMVGHVFGPRAAEHTLARGRNDQPVRIGAGTGARRGNGLSGSDWRALAAELEAQEAAA